MEEIKCKGRRVIFESSLRELPNGVKARIDKVVFPNSVAILPLFLDSCNIILIRQYRPAIEKWILEIPAGVIDPGEKPEETARRELEEEAGLKANRLVKIGEGYVSPGYSTEHMTLFLALNPSPGFIHREEHEVIERIVKINISEAIDMIAKGEIEDIKTILAVYAAREHCMSQ